MAKLETVKIVNGASYLVINKDDFDPQQHTLYEEPDSVPDAAAAEREAKRAKRETKRAAKRAARETSPDGELSSDDAGAATDSESELDGTEDTGKASERSPKVESDESAAAADSESLSDNDYIVTEAEPEPPESEEVSLVIRERADALISKKTVSELRKMGRDLSIKRYSRLTEAELALAIAMAEANADDN